MKILNRARLILACPLLLMLVPALAQPTGKFAVAVVGEDTNITTAIEERLLQSTCCDVVDVAERETMLAELAHSQSGLTERDLRIGRQLAADRIITVHQSDNRFSIRLSDVERGKLIAAEANVSSIDIGARVQMMINALEAQAGLNELARLDLREGNIE
ncbi:MAG: hypothetical protein KDK30_18810, partial [Leptospiraceae bacterium]|nr:hypothetical protein [Leptospiraceae bacterium]